MRHTCVILFSAPERVTQAGDGLFPSPRSRFHAVAMPPDKAAGPAPLTVVRREKGRGAQETIGC